MNTENPTPFRRAIVATFATIVLVVPAGAGQSEPGPPELPVTGLREFSIAQYDYLNDGTRMTETEILDAFVLSSYSIRQFYREVSYGLVDLDVVELLDAITDLHPPESDCWPAWNHVLIELDEELEPDPYWPDIDHHLALVHNSCSVNMSSFGNLAGWPTLSHGTQYMPLAKMNAVAYTRDFAGLTSSTWAHEIGHGFGIPFHSQAYVCSVNGPLSDNPDDCVNVPTGHQHDLMGSRHAGTHLNGHFKEYLGWIDAANKTTIQGDGCYLMDLHDLAQPAAAGLNQYVVIDLVEGIPARTQNGTDIDFDQVTLEFRGHTGFDQRSYKEVPLAGGGARNVTAAVNAFGILVQGLNCDNKTEPWYPCVVYEIDMQPNTMEDTTNPDFWDPIDGFLLDGQAWDVPRNPVTVRVLDTMDAPESIRILVEYGAAGSTWFRDADGDGFGDPVTSDTACVQPSGYVANADDCDDGATDTYPGAPEVNDGSDNQCPGDPGHGVIDEISGSAGFHDGVDEDLYSWDAQPGATLYEVARSTARDHSVGCTTVETSQPSWTDSESPPSGIAFYYLTRSVAPHVGSWGQDSAGSERADVCP